ncbi:hypothetical protein ACFGVR_20090 [Mucilaginibacter sp. AW1-3]
MLATPITISSQLVDKGPSWLGLDASWNMTLNYALMKHWIWGKDILYTYGPLAFFSTRNGWGISKWIFLLFDGFIVVNFYFVFIDLIKSNADKFLAVALLICTMLTVNQCLGTDLSWVILFFIIYWMIKTFNEQRPVYMAMLILLTVLAFYIKLNTGLIASVLFCGHIINLFVCKKLTIVKVLVYLVSFIILIIVSAVLLHVSIFSYVFGSLEIVKGYNEIMYLDEDHYHVEHNLYILFFAMLLYFCYQLWKQVRGKKYNRIIYTIAGIIYIFLLQKQSILRNDVQHLYEYFSFAPLILLCEFGDAEGHKPHLKYALVIMLFALFFVADNRTIDVSFNSRVKAPAAYVKQFGQYNSATYLNQQNKRYLPQRVLHIIGNKTVDVFPWDSEYALENKLNYKPRPAFQSFSVYTAALEKINYDYYVKQAPAFLIYDYDAIDDRYPFNDEGFVNLFILNNYTFVDSLTSNERLRLVLQRNVKTVPLRFTRQKQQQFLLNDSITTDQFNFIKLDIHYSAIGKLKALLHRPPHLQICYMREDGQWFNYKTSIELLKAGLYLGNLVTNTNDYLTLLTGKHVPAIKKIKFNYNGTYFNTNGRMETCIVDCPRDTSQR